MIRLTKLRLVKYIIAGFSSFTVTLLISFNVTAIIHFPSGSYSTFLKTVPSVSSTSSTTAELPLASERCRQLLGADDVLVIVKTGATALRERLPVHFQTTLQCIQHSVIFSDMEEDFEGHHVYDVLSGVSAEMKNSAPEFKFYHDLHENQDRVTEFMRDISAQRKAWHLDKWKFLPIVGRALQAKPDAKWFMFIEADTFLVWSNLLNWLSQLDSREPYFLGLPVTMEGQLFAYGGAGWLLSRPAIQRMTDHMASEKGDYEDFTNKTSFGDLILGHVLEQAGIGLTGAWPLIQRETPSTMEYTKDLWCYPVVTFHHIDALGIKSIWDLEQEWIADMQAPLLHFDIFNYLIYPLLAPKSDDWDNFSQGEEKLLTSNEGFEDCKLLCEEDVQCMQFRFTPKRCTISHAITLGWKADPSINSTSGWMMERIAQIKARVQCEGNKWILID